MATKTDLNFSEQVAVDDAAAAAAAVVVVVVVVVEKQDVVLGEPASSQPTDNNTGNVSP
jgi:hypothetical protein